MGLLSVLMVLCQSVPIWHIVVVMMMMIIITMIVRIRYVIMLALKLDKVARIIKLNKVIAV